MTRPVHRDDGRAFGEPVTLHDRHPRCFERQGDIEMQRCAAADENAQPVAAELRFQLAEHEFLGERVLHAQAEAERGAIEFGALVAPPGRERPRHELGLDPAGRTRIRDDAGKGAFEDAGHAEHDDGPHRAQVVEQRFDVPVDVDLRAPDEIAENVGTFVDVRVRQDREHRIAGPDQVGYLIEGGMRVRAEVAVREHHAFRRTGRARGIDDGREIAGRHRRRSRAEYSAPVRDHGVQGVRIVGGSVEYDRIECDAVGTQALRDRRRVDEQLARTGIGNDETHVVGGLGGIDRHRDAAGKENAEVRDDPVDAVWRHQRDAVAGREPARAQRRGDGRDAGQDIGGAECAPTRVGCAFVQDGTVGSGKRSAREIDECHEAPFVQNPKQAR